MTTSSSTPSRPSSSSTTNNNTHHHQEQEPPPPMAWVYSFGAMMVPFTAFCVGHAQGMTGKIVESVVRSPVGVYGLFVLPFATLAMEKSIYDTVQAYQGINPNTRPADRGGFPSGGAELPSFSLIPIQDRSK